MAEPLKPKDASKVRMLYESLKGFMDNDPEKRIISSEYFTEEYLKRIPAHDFMIILAARDISFIRRKQ